MQHNVFTLISASDVPQMIQIVHSLCAADWNPEYQHIHSYFITAVTIFLYVYIVLAFLM